MMNHKRRFGSGNFMHSFGLSYQEGGLGQTCAPAWAVVNRDEHDRIQHAERDTLSNVPVIYLLLKSDGNDGLEYV